MSPSYVNDSDTPVRVDSPNELTGAPQLQRLVPGQVVEADGKFADNLAATEGVREASSDELAAYRDSIAVKAVTPGARLAQKLALPGIRLALRRAATVAPLQRVVGDDAAPFGPPSGEVTTVQDAAREDREHFLPGDVLPEEKIPHAGTPAASVPRSQEPSSEEIHNAQAASQGEAEDFTERWLEAGQTEPEALSAHFNPTPPEREAGPHEGEEFFDGSEGDDYDGEEWTQEKLAAELESRDLPKSGTKDEQIARLRENDAAKAEEE